MVVVVRVCNRMFFLFFFFFYNLTKCSLSFLGSILLVTTGANVIDDEMSQMRKGTLSVVVFFLSYFCWYEHVVIPNAYMYNRSINCKDLVYLSRGSGPRLGLYKIQA
jgi:hypothetical protein